MQTTYRLKIIELAFFLPLPSFLSAWWLLYTFNDRIIFLSIQIPVDTAMLTLKTIEKLKLDRKAAPPNIFKTILCQTKVYCLVWHINIVHSIHVTITVPSGIMSKGLIAPSFTLNFSEIQSYMIG